MKNREIQWKTVNICNTPPLRHMKWNEKWNRKNETQNPIYTNLAKGILDFCKQKLTAPPMAMSYKWTNTLVLSEIWILNENDKTMKP